MVGNNNVILGVFQDTPEGQNFFFDMNSRGKSQSSGNKRQRNGEILM